MPKNRTRSPGRFATKAAVLSPMIFNEKDSVMAKWPGTALFYRAVVTFVRPRDNEYDVMFEDDGTIFTIPAKDVMKRGSIRTMKKTLSRSRGRSPSRSRVSSIKSPPTSTPISTSRSITKSKSISHIEPQRKSSRIAEKIAAISADEDDAGYTADKKYFSSSKDVTTLSSKNWNLNLEWLTSLFFMILAIFIIISLHTLCSKTTCRPVLPQFSKKLEDYWNTLAFVIVAGFVVFLHILAYLPVGKLIFMPHRRAVYMNGFITLILALSVFPVLVYKKVNLSFVSEKYFQLMISSLLFAFLQAFVVYFLSYWNKNRLSNDVNPKGNTGNPIVDFIAGRDLNPVLASNHLKLQAYRFSMIGLALLNVALVLPSITKPNYSRFSINPTIMLASASQICYTLDAMYFEEYYLSSMDASKGGYGLKLIAEYFLFPFYPTLVIQYLIRRNPRVYWGYLVLIGLFNVFGYFIFRSSDTQRFMFSENPKNPCVAHLKSISGSYGHKLIVSGWWGHLRHPTILGEILVHWSWTLPAVLLAGRVDLLVYFFPVTSTLMFLSVMKRQNLVNKQRFGSAWDSYAKRVSSDIIPMIY